MSKSASSDRRKGANPPHRLDPDRPSRDSLVSQPPRDERDALERLIDAPHMAQVVPHLAPEVLHRIIMVRGLEDCADLVAMATPAQLQSVFDVDLWRASRPGMDEQLDANRFAVWLDVLMEAGATIAAQKIAGLDADLAIAALAQHIRVFDRAAAAPSMDDADAPLDGSRHEVPDCEVGSYLVLARRTDAWDAIVGLLLALDAEQPECFHRLMRGCRAVSNSTPEIDASHDLLTEPEQDMFELAVDREERRERMGYVTAAQARAFLQSARELPPAQSMAPRPDPIARAYFRAVEVPTPPEPNASGSDAARAALPPVSNVPPDAFAAVVDGLLEAGVLPAPPRALLDGPRERARFAQLRMHLELAYDRHQAASSTRTAELAFLANALLAGCSVQGRPFTPQEAADAAAAICNLGLQNWPGERHRRQADGMASAVGADTGLAEDFLVDHDLIGVFQVGWAVLYRDVCMYTAGQLIGVVGGLRTKDRAIQAGLDVLGFEMDRRWRAGAPWLARDALDVIMILDQPAWAALVGLIGECPVVHAALAASVGRATRAIDGAAFEFIAENRQISSIRTFLQALPDLLRPGV